MISDWIIKTTRHLHLSEEQIAAQANLPEAQHLRVTNAQRIIYPGKNHDKWWDLERLKDRLVDAIDIFEYLHVGAAGIWVFDCSSAHEGLAANALNVNNMNVHLGGKQTIMQDTIGPLNHPAPENGKSDTPGHLQTMVYAHDHPNPDLAGKAKGMATVVKERESVYNRLIKEVGSDKKVIGKCSQCRKSATKKDAECRVALAEMASQEDSLDDAILDEASGIAEESQNKWCCLYQVISLQKDFVNEKPEIQHYLEGTGHVCMFYPKFHCEINPIEMLWGYIKYCEWMHIILHYLISEASTGFHAASDGKFLMAKLLVPQCLNMADVPTIRQFFRKSWCYMDAYQYMSHTTFRHYYLTMFTEQKRP